MLGIVEGNGVRDHSRRGERRSLIEEMKGSLIKFFFSLSLPQISI